jgi:hypothetical protein
MKISELIKALENQNPDKEIVLFVWNYKTLKSEITPLELGASNNNEKYFFFTKSPFGQIPDGDF